MTWTSLDNWIVIAGVLCAMACALPGNFLVLRKMSMMGDAISHAVLPGLAVAFLITESRASVPMFIGAAVVGVLTAVFTEWIRGFGKVEESAAMGVVFTSLFAIGLIMIVQAADKVDLDPGCVLYGAIEMTPLDTVAIAGREIPRAVATLAVIFVVNLLFVLLFFKELRISSFDPALATTLGINARVMHYALMTLVAMTTVAAFESVGSILVVAMLIVPAAAAHLLTDRLAPMIIASLIIAALSAVLGHVGAISIPSLFGYVDTSTAGMMGVAAGGLFFITLMFAPRHGVLSKVIHQAILRQRITGEDALGLAYRMEELQIEPSAKMDAAMLREALKIGPLRARMALRRLFHAGALSRSRRHYELTEAGRTRARNLVRSHRLWEAYLHKFLALPSDHVHHSAEQLEHITDRDMQTRLAERTEQPSRDPQGKTIPPGSSSESSPTHTA